VGLAFRDFDSGSRELLVTHLAAVAAEVS
jgi:hypothetical protein